MWVNIFHAPHNKARLYLSQPYPTREAAIAGVSRNCKTYLATINLTELVEPKTINQMEQQKDGASQVGPYVIENISAEEMVPIKQTPEYKVLDQLQVNQSVSFKSEMKKTFMYAQNIFHKESTKRFFIRKLDSSHHRIFRMADQPLGMGLKRRTIKKQPK